MMKTDELIDMLATQAGSVSNPLSAQRLACWLLPAVAVSILTVTGWLGFVPVSLFVHAGPWVKLGYGVLLVLVCAQLLARAGQPGAISDRPVRGPVLVALLVFCLGLAQFLVAPDEQRDALIWGHSWSQCPRNIFVLSIPILAALLGLMRSLAPVRPALAGAYAGLVAGAIAAMVYALACTETALLFIAIWYTGGILLTTGLGALLGRFVLRW